MLINSQRVEEMFIACLFTDEEAAEGATESAVIAEGITMTCGFHPDRLEEHREEVVATVLALPEPFHEDSGGGWSFLNMNTTQSGEEWTGLHRNMELLLCLGVAVGRMKILVPREMWGVFPGGVPYVAVTDGKV